MNRAASLGSALEDARFPLAEKPHESTVREGPKPIETLLRLILCLLAASLPNESILGNRDRWAGTGNTLPYYVGIAAVALSIFFLPRLFRSATRSRAWQLIVGAYTVAFAVLLILNLTGQIRWLPEYTGSADRWCKNFYMSLLFITFIQDVKWRRRVLLSYLGGWAFFVCAVLLSMARGDASVITVMGASRAAVSDMNENVQSMFGASGTILVVVEALRAKSVRWLAACAVAFVAGLAAMSVGSSRTAYASFAVALVFVIVISMRRPPAGAWLSRGRAIAAICLFLAAGIWLMSKVTFLESGTSSMTTRFDAAFSGRDMGSRDELAAATWRIFLDNPEGVGLGRTQELLGDIDPHNCYLKILAEGGVFGITIFLAAAYVVARNCRQWLRQSTELAPMSCLVLFAGIWSVGTGAHRTTFLVFFLLFRSSARGGREHRRRWLQGACARSERSPRARPSRLAYGVALSIGAWV